MAGSDRALRPGAGRRAPGVSLEVNHHLDWIDRERVYETQVRWHLERLGVAPASDLRDRLDRLGHLWTPRLHTGT